MKRPLSFVLTVFCLLSLLVSCTAKTTSSLPASQSETKEQTVTPLSPTTEENSDTVSSETFSSSESVTPPTEQTDIPSEQTEPTAPTEPTEPTETVIPTPSTTETPSTETPVRPTDGWLLHETSDAGLDYQNKLIFLGDSTTYGMIPYKALPDGENTKQVWKGSVGNTITFLYVEDVKILYPETGEELTIIEAAKKAQPEYLVITLGVTGGVSQNLSKENFLKLYKWLVDNILKVSPDTSIIVQSIFPVNKEIWDTYKNITNQKIETTNDWLKEMAKEYYDADKKVFYADTYPSLLDSEGYMKKEYGNGDGLHLSLAGYEVILKYLRTHALTLQ